MQWKVTNALSRDVEREHLNKILKEIQGAIDSASQSQSVSDADIVQAVRRLFEGTHKGLKIAYNPSTKRMEVTTDSFTITLQGAVSGQGTVTSNGNVTIDTAISAGAAGIGEAPNTGEAFWRRSQDWEVVPIPVEKLAYVEPPGFPALQADFGWITRTIDGTPGNIVVTDGDGVSDNPTIDLATVADSGNGTLVGIERDVYGRITGTKAVVAGDNITIDDSGATIIISFTGGAKELLVADGVSPPEFLWDDTETDYLYAD